MVQYVQLKDVQLKERAAKERAINTINQPKALGRPAVSLASDSPSPGIQHLSLPLPLPLPYYCFHQRTVSDINVCLNNFKRSKTKL